MEAFPAEWSACRIISAFITRRCSGESFCPVIIRSIISEWDSPAFGPSYGRPAAACAITPTRWPTFAMRAMPRAWTAPTLLSKSLSFGPRAAAAACSANIGCVIVAAVLAAGLRRR